MNNTKRLWQCEICSDILGYNDIHQQANSGSVLCKDCFDLYHVMGDEQQVPPRLCEECGTGIGRSVLAQSTGWKGHGRLIDLCLSCSAGVDPEEEDEAIMGLLNILNQTDVPETEDD